MNGLVGWRRSERKHTAVLSFGFGALQVLTDFIYLSIFLTLPAMCQSVAKVGCVCTWEYMATCSDSSSITTSYCSYSQQCNFPRKIPRVKLWKENFYLKFIINEIYFIFPMANIPSEDGQSTTSFHAHGIRALTHIHSHLPRSSWQNCGKSHGNEEKDTAFSQFIISWKTSNSINFEISKLANDIVFSLFRIIAFRLNFLGVCVYVWMSLSPSTPCIHLFWSFHYWSGSGLVWFSMLLITTLVEVG